MALNYVSAKTIQDDRHAVNHFCLGLRVRAVLEAAKAHKVQGRHSGLTASKHIGYQKYVLT